MNPLFWKDKKVFITGHTGFKGSWICMWLHQLGAEIIGYSLSPRTPQDLYYSAKINTIVKNTTGDIRDFESLKTALINAEPDIVIHMAAQPLVKASYTQTYETYSINVLGTVTLFEAIRIALNEGIPIKAVLNVTTDKVYENKEWVYGYRETDRLGGYDPYSCSKACSEMITSSYRSSFFNSHFYDSHGVAIATARSGNVIGGGDLSEDRLVPDCLKALMTGENLVIRNSEAQRPWQHVLEPLRGYLILLEKLVSEGATFGESWNFGSSANQCKSVEWIVNRMIKKWGGTSTKVIVEPDPAVHETMILKLDSSKTESKLGWNSVLDLDRTLDLIIDWNKRVRCGEDTRTISLNQIKDYMNLVEERDGNGV